MWLLLLVEGVDAEAQAGAHPWARNGWAVVVRLCSCLRLSWFPLLCVARGGDETSRPDVGRTSSGDLSLRLAGSPCLRDEQEYFAAVLYLGD